ncbi:hypothetical protein DL765_002044 [Monosporascus sp. GIB2]|nr:hypothetical protein DL765_002044 [Monosporascus sp. GIB2]
MVSSRKRARRDIELEEHAESASAPGEASLLRRIRNTWQFANLYQWIYLFGKVVKIDENIDIDDLETECLKPQSTVLVDIGLALLKFVSSHRGLTPELFDEYTRRQYVAKAPQRNPFGTDEVPAKFNGFDVFTKLRVLQQLTQWVMLHPERIREKMDEQKLTDQTEWRIEPSGWDSQDRTYYILDDNRVYRLTEAPPVTPTWKPKKNTKKAKAAARAAKRRRVSRSAAEGADSVEEDQGADAEEAPEPEDDGLGGAKWECIATNLEEVRNFLGTIQKSRDENEKVLKKTIEEHLLPLLEKQEESRKRKALQREKELLNLQKMANAKRSSRLASKAEQQRAEAQAREEEEKRRKEEITARKEEQRRLKMEKERDNRLMSREARLKERETRRLRHEEELAQLSEDSKNAGTANGRLSERRLKAEIEKNKQALKELDEEEDDWIFDCICGAYGHVDDGTHSVACERCNVWQHSKCLGVSEEEADGDDFHFICKTCERKHLGGTTDPEPESTVASQVNRHDGPPLPQARSDTSAGKQQPSAPSRSVITVDIPCKLSWKPDLSPQAIDSSQPHPAIPLPTSSNIPTKNAGQPNVPPPHSPHANANGEAPHPFSSPHPTLSPPNQSPSKSRAYSSLRGSSSPTPAYQSIGKPSLPQKGVFHVSSSTNGVSQGSPSRTRPPPADAQVTPTAARSDSPLKQPFEAANSNPPVLSPPAASFSVGRPATSSGGSQSTVASTPQLKHAQAGPEAALTPTLVPTQNGIPHGISPLKRSPPPAQPQNNGINPSPAPAILPPVAALSPSPSHQDLTPPVKPTEPMRPSSQHSSGVAGDMRLDGRFG